MKKSLYSPIFLLFIIIVAIIISYICYYIVKSEHLEDTKKRENSKNMMCIPPIIHDGTPTTCINKNKLNKEQAYRACVGVSDEYKQCNLLFNKNNCKNGDYECVVDESDSCSHNLCNLNDNSDLSSNCTCQKTTENLRNNIGRMCQTGTQCRKYLPNRKAPELYSDPSLSRFYDGYSSYMNVPTLDTKIGILLADAQII